MTAAIDKFFSLISISCFVSSAFADDVITFDLVRTSAGVLEARMPYEPSTSAGVGDRLELSSEDGYDFGLSISKTSYSELGNRIIHASTDAGGKAVLVVSADGTMLGSISEYGDRHQISTTAEGLKRIARAGLSGFEKRMDAGGLAPYNGPLRTEIQLELTELEASSSPFRIMKNEESSDVIYPAYKTGTATISILVYYDDSMYAPLTTIDYIEQITNEAFFDSGAEVEVKIVGAKPLDIDDGLSHADVQGAMNSGDSPFQDIGADRSFFSADVVFTLRGEANPDEQYCGRAPSGVYRQYHFRSAFEGVVQWLPVESGVSYYCSDYLFAHELGHILGGQHHREDLNEDGDTRYGAYSYSYGRYLEGAVHTIMASGSGIGVGERLFSNPTLYCNGYPCGIPKSRPDSADNASTFQSTGHLIASNEGAFAFEAVSTYASRLGDSECTTSDDEAGFWTGAGLRNQSAFTVELLSQHFKRVDGSYAVYEFDPGERVVEPGSSTGGGFCRAESEEPVFGTTFTEVFMRYRHPETGAIVETETHEAASDYDGEYRTVRIASGQGGSVTGNPAQSVRVGSSKAFTFTPDSGYSLAGIESNCTGRRTGNSYTVDVGEDNCFVQAFFDKEAQAATLRLSIENPAEGQTYSGVGTFQGWAVAQEGVASIDLYVDGSFFQQAPYGGSRRDVGNVFPDVPNSSNSGFALAYNFGNLSAGRHTLRAVAVTADGRTLEATTPFYVSKFHKAFIGPSDSVDLNEASCSLQGNQMSVIDALIDGKSYDISLEWRTGTQGFEIYRIR